MKKEKKRSTKDLTTEELADKGNSAPLRSSLFSKGSFIATSLVTLILLPAMFLAGYSANLDSKDYVLKPAKFVSVDRALGENSQDRTLRSCMVEVVKRNMTEAGALTDKRDGGAINFEKLLEYIEDGNTLNFENGNGIHYNEGVFTRATIPGSIMQECSKGLMNHYIAVGDLNGDLLPEVAYYGSDGKFNLYTNSGAGRFKFSQLDALKLYPAPGLTETFFRFTPVSFVDANDDGWLDIVTFVFNRLTTMYNDGKGGFIGSPDVSFSTLDGTIPPSLENMRGVPMSIINADLNVDGLLDLVVANRATLGEVTASESDTKDSDLRPVRVFYNTGQNAPRWSEGTSKAFKNIQKLTGGTTLTARSTTTGPDISGSFIPLIADFNNDGWPDIYVAADFTVPRMFFAKSGGMEYVDKSRESGVLEGFQNTMGASAIDYNEDGWLDILASDNDVSLGHCSGNRPCTGVGGHRVLINNKNSTFTDKGREIGIADFGWGYGFSYGDLNLDGWQDILMGTGDIATSRANDQWAAGYQKPYLLSRTPNGWEDNSYSLLRPLRAVTAMQMVTSADFDGDTKPDLLLSGFENYAPYLLLNRTTGNSALLVVKGKGKGGSPRTGEGVKVEITVKNAPKITYILPSAQSNFQISVSGAPLSIGLGPDGEATVKVYFPVSKKTVEKKITTDGTFVISE